jgi:hypothetical protein
MRETKSCQAMFERGGLAKRAVKVALCFLLSSLPVAAKAGGGRGLDRDFLFFAMMSPRAITFRYQHRSEISPRLKPIVNLAARSNQ